MALILLDAGLVGLAILPPHHPGPEGQDFRAWFSRTQGTIHQFAIADVTQYEVARGLLYKGAVAKLMRLGHFIAATLSVESSREVWEQAAGLWAKVRRQGQPTASDASLDGDAILAASALVVAGYGEPVVIATTNVKHLSRFGVDGREWRDIPDSE